MELTFNKTAKSWACEFEATSNFNLHLERDDEATIIMYQKTTQDGEYSTYASWSEYKAPKVIDIDFGGLVYPKHIKIESLSEPTKAVVTFS